jgi:hypothetical protein
MITPGVNTSGLDQFLHENQTWERALDYFLQENAFLKMRLSQVLDRNTDRSFVVLAEHFQTCFVQMDECMKDLRKEILLSQKALKAGALNQATELARMYSRHKKLQTDMNYLQKKFAELTTEFNHHVISLYRS